MHPATDADTAPDRLRFWGEWPIPVGQVGHWCLGPLELWICRLEQEWRMVVGPPGGLHDTDVMVEVPGAAPDPGLEVRRFATGGPAHVVRFRPRPPDRSVVIRPESPFQILSGDEVTVYVSCPVWVQVVTADGRPICELPVLQPSDTWLGTPLSGELCYASRTRARLHFDNVVVAPSRALSTITVRNRASAPLTLERIAVRAPELALFLDVRGNLWTQTLVVDRLKDDVVEVRVGASPPEQAGPVERVGEPRVSNGRGVFVRALDTLFG